MRFLVSPEQITPEKILKSRGVTMGHDLRKRAEFPTTKCLAGSCIVWRASVGWKAVFSGQYGKPQYFVQRNTILFLFSLLIVLIYSSDIILLDWVLLGGS